MLPETTQAVLYMSEASDSCKSLNNRAKPWNLQYSCTQQKCDAACDLQVIPSAVSAFKPTPSAIKSGFARAVEKSYSHRCSHVAHTSTGIYSSILMHIMSASRMVEMSIQLTFCAGTECFSATANCQLCSSEQTAGLTASDAEQPCSKRQQCCRTA